MNEPKIAHLSATPVAGAAWAASESFKEAGYESICVARSSYSDGRLFPCDGGWPPADREIEMIRDADLIFCHQGMPYSQQWYPREKATVNWYHSQPTPGHIDRRAEKDGWPWGVVGQYQTRLYPGSSPLPNLMPLAHSWYQPASNRSNSIVRIAYSPSNLYMSGWDDKGYAETISAMRESGAEFNVITGTPLEECLRIKSMAHIVVDECVTGSYHRSSLDGMALGCVVVNNCDDLCQRNIEQMTGSKAPFLRASIKTLTDTLQGLVNLGAKHLNEWGEANRRWMEIYWNATGLIERNFVPLVDAAFRNLRA